MPKSDPSTLRSTRRKMSAEARAQQIVSVAALLFDKYGFAETTMNDIAEAIGVSKPTLYHYYKSKDQILLAIHEEFIELLIERHESRISAELAPEQLLLEIMVDILELMETHHGYVRVFFEHHRELPADARSSVRARRIYYESIVENLINESKTAGHFQDVDTKLAALAVFGVCNWAYQWYRPGGSKQPREIANHFWSYLMFGLADEKFRDSHNQ